jgi:hypothetical protein
MLVESDVQPGMRGILPSSTLDAFKAWQNARESITLFSDLYENN